MRQIKFNFIYFLTLFNCYLFSQQTITGKIVASEEIVLEKITILNLNTKKTTFTDELGYFTIDVSVNDALFISAVHLKSIQYQIKPADFNKKILFIRIAQQINQLEEVVIKTSTIDAVSLGILQTPAKKYTVAERRLRTAGNFKWYSPLLIPLGGMPFDGLINTVSGRKKMLEKNLEIERLERDLNKLENFCDENYYVQNLNIEKEYIDGFQIYALENIELRKAIKANNKTLVQFLLAQIAEKYKSISQTNIPKNE